MPVLANPKHETFAQAVARGSSAAAAYVEAGYKENRHNAATLARKQHILTRVTELQEEQLSIHQQATAQAAAGVLHDKRMQHGWKYGDHYFPHDIKIRELSSGQSRLQSLAALGIEAIAVPQSNVLDGINVTRRMLGRTWIDGNRCERGIEALRQYRREYDDRLKDWKRNPLHDWTSHGADALRTFACGFDDTPVQSYDPHWRGRQGVPPPRGTHWSA
jgi:hypothetical protein